MTKAFVFDLDGVIRHWDPEIVASAENAHGLPPGALFAVAFEPDLLLEAVTGKISDEAWRQEVARRLQVEHPEANGTGAVHAWSEPHGEIIAGSLEVLDRARGRGPVCLLSNATSRLDSDLVALRIADRFDHIFNSSAIGFAKPDEQVFQHVERVLGVDPGHIVYVDDSSSNVKAASQRGWISLHATPEVPLSELLIQHMR